jgi:hypothetical protein
LPDARLFNPTRSGGYLHRAISFWLILASSATYLDSGECISVLMLVAVVVMGTWFRVPLGQAGVGIAVTADDCDISVRMVFL